MLEIPHGFFINSTLQIGTVYKIVAPELIKTSLPHYFIIVAIEDEDNYMLLCSARKESREKYITKAGHDYSTLVYIKPDKNNGFTKDTYVDCNRYHQITKSSLLYKQKTGMLKYVGQLSLNHYMQIKNGIINSYINDLPEYLLRHPNE